jgi:hypothetical protein
VAVEEAVAAAVDMVVAEVMAAVAVDGDTEFPERTRVRC